MIHLAPLTIVTPCLLFSAWLFSLFFKYIWPLLLLLFPAYCSPHGYSLFKKKVHMAPLAIVIFYLLFPSWLLFICCSLFFKVHLAPLVIATLHLLLPPCLLLVRLLMFLVCVFLDSILLPPIFFAGNFWSYDQQAKASKEGEFF